MVGRSFFGDAKFCSFHLFVDRKDVVAIVASRLHRPFALEGGPCWCGSSFYVTEARVDELHVQFVCRSVCFQMLNMGCDALERRAERMTFYPVTDRSDARVIMLPREDVSFVTEIAGLLQRLRERDIATDTFFCADDDEQFGELFDGHSLKPDVSRIFLFDKVRHLLRC